MEVANLKVSAGITGDSCDNAWAATVNGLYKTEVIEYLKSDWAATADVELAIYSYDKAKRTEELEIIK